MAANPQFRLLAGLVQNIETAQSAETVSEGKGCYAFVDSKLNRIPDLGGPIVADAVFAYSVNEKKLEHLCAHVDVIGDKNVMVTGRRGPLLNSKIDADKLPKYQQQFDALVAVFRKEPLGG